MDNPFEIANADCMDWLKLIPSNSIDAIVTDPPYGLSFMGKKWDYDVPGVEIWQEALLVLKPGGYLLAFAGTRTQHRMACRIEDAGFEIRDMIAWVYGSGFPKSLNIGKAVDELRGVERESLGTVAGMGKQNPEWNGTAQGRSENSFKPEYEATCSTSEWEGWGTNLKPALEPITVARKPLSENTVATNCLKWGTGGINIDGCRIPYKSEQDLPSSSWYSAKGGKLKKEKPDGFSPMKQGQQWQDNPIGRFPANLIHDGSEEVLAGFPETKSGKMKEGQLRNSKPLLGTQNDQIHETFGDSGSAARFFYCAKASASERNYGVDGGNKHPTVKPVALMEYLVKLVSREGAVVLDPFMGSGTTGVAAIKNGRRFWGCELDAGYFASAEQRLIQAAAQPVLTGLVEDCIYQQEALEV